MNQQNKTILKEPTPTHSPAMLRDTVGFQHKLQGNRGPNQRLIDPAEKQSIRAGWHILCTKQELAQGGSGWQAAAQQGGNFQRGRSAGPAGMKLRKPNPPQ